MTVWDYLWDLYLCISMALFVGVLFLLAASYRVDLRALVILWEIWSGLKARLPKRWRPS